MSFSFFLERNVCVSDVFMFEPFGYSSKNDVSGQTTLPIMFTLKQNNHVELPFFSLTCSFRQERGN